MRRVLVHQTVRTVLLRKLQMPRPVDRNHDAAPQTRRVQHFHPEEPPHHLCPQRRQRRAPRMAQKVIQRIVHRQRLLPGAGQAIDIR
jgi:hypothetical protein